MIAAALSGRGGVCRPTTTGPHGPSTATHWAASLVRVVGAHCIYSSVALEV